MNRARPPRLALALSVVSVLGWAHSSSAQSGVEPGVADQPSTGSTVVRSEVRRDINRYRWVFGGSTEQQVGSWLFAADSRFTSDAFVLFDRRLSFRDEYDVSATVSRPLRPGLSFRTATASEWFSLSRVLTHQTWAGIEFELSPWATLQPRIGIAIDRRPGAATSSTTSPLRTDRGPAAGWLATFRSSSDNYRLRVDSRADARRIDPRRDLAFLVTSAASGSHNDTRWTTNAAVSSFRRDTYLAASFLNRNPISSFAEAIEQTTSDTLAFSGSLDTPIYRGVRLTGSGDLMFNRRMVRGGERPPETLFFETDFGRRSVQVDIATLLERRRSRLQFGFRVGAESEERTLANRLELPAIQAAQKSLLLQQADSERGYYGVSASIRFDVGARTTVTTNGDIQLARHDSPEVNPDDRDERSTTGNVAVRTHVTRALALDTRLYANRYETVYIKSERSAENNTQSSLRLQTNLVWNPSERTRARIGPEIRATYTVDDFDLEGRPARDQSARELSYRVEIEHRLLGDMTLEMNATHSDLRLGRFIEERFAEVPFDTLRTASGEFRIRVGSRHTAEFGVRLFTRSDHNPATRVSHRRRDANGSILVDADGNALSFTTTRPGLELVRQIGPVAAVSWRLNGLSLLRLDGWLNFQKQYQRLYGELPAPDAEEIRRAASRGSTRMTPNVALSMIWNL